MPDYIGAFNEGLKAAEEASRAKREIDEVFSEICEQLKTATKGNLTVRRSELPVPPTGWQTLVVNPFEPRKMYSAIVAWNPSVQRSSAKEIARWSQDVAGYPCKITCQSWERTCEDRQALENSLAELLREPTVGEKLYALMKLPEAQEPTGDDEKSVDDSRGEPK